MLVNDFWKCSFLSYFIKQTDLTMLDVGCGNGNITQYFKDKGMIVQGLDITPHVFDFSFLKADLSEGLPKCLFESNYDVVICTQVLEHIINPELIIKEMYRISNRIVLMTFPVGRSYFDPEHINFWFEPEQVKATLDSALKAIPGVSYDICTIPTKVEDIKNGQRNWLVAIEKKVSDE